MTDIMIEHIKIWQAAKEGGYRIKAFHVPEDKVEEYCRTSVLKHPKAQRSKVWREGLAMDLRERLMAGEVTYFGIPVKVTPSFKTVAQAVLRDNRDNLLDVMCESNSVFNQFTVQ